MKMRNLKSFAESRRVKHGTLNLIFIAVVIAIVIMLNSIVTVLAESFGWQLDMTEEQLYTVSDEFVALIDEVSGEIPIDIIFCCDKDEAEQNFVDKGTNTSSAMAYIHSTATQIADRLDNVSVMYIDPVKDYEFIRKFNQVSSQIDPSESTVIIARRDANGEYGTMYRVYHATSFYTFAQSQVDGTNQIYGYSGERTFATAILSLTYDETPTVYFVAGHSEDVPYSTDDGDYYIPQIAKVFLDCGFRARYIYLGEDEKQFTCTKAGCRDSWGYKEIGNTESFVCSCDTVYETDKIDFNEKRTIPYDARAIIINNPTGDYGANELSKLSEYLISKRGTIMCFTDPSVGENKLENLYKFVKQETGVTVVGGDVVKDGSSTSINGVYDFRGDIADNDAATTYLSALQGFSAKEPIINNSGILEIAPEYVEGISDVLADRITAPLIQTDRGATFNDREGRYDVLSVTALTTMYQNEEVQSYFVVCPSTGFIDDDYMSNSMYPNSDIMLALIHSTTAVNVPVDLDFKTFSSYQLDITSSQASTIFVCLITIMPVVAVAIGVFVIVRRKHR